MTCFMPRSEQGFHKRESRQLCPTSDNRCYVRFGLGFSPKTLHLPACPMRSDVSDNDDEDWDNDDESYDDEPDACCPECGGTVYNFADKCPHCGYWISGADRRAMWPSLARPLWLRVTAIVVLLAFLASLLAVGGFLF
jgi:hypothetical protein